MILDFPISYSFESLMTQPWLVMTLALAGLMMSSTAVSWGLGAWESSTRFATQLASPWAASPPPSKSVKDLRTRVKSWWAILAVVTPLFAAGDIGMTIGIAIIAFVAMREFLSSADLSATPHLASAVALYLLVPVQFAFAWFTDWVMFSAVPVLMYAALQTVKPNLTYRPLIGAGLIVASLSFIVHLLTLDLAALTGSNAWSGFDLVSGGALLIAHIFAVAQVSDAMQYSVGKVLGRTPLARSISPNKTWEGAIGGGILALVVGSSFALFTPLSLVQAAVLSAVVVVLGIVGGLVFSAIKRRRGIKDWSQLIPGHGGVVDRLDSVILALPAYYIVLHWMTP